MTRRVSASHWSRAGGVGAIQVTGHVDCVELPTDLVED